MGYLLLAGGAEFGGRMSEPDLRAIELAGGFDAPICIIPTAAAPDNNHKRAGNNGIRWFKSLGAKNVFAVDVINSVSANDSSLAASIRASRLIYLLGGFPRHLGETLKTVPAGALRWMPTKKARSLREAVRGQWFYVSIITIPTKRSYCADLT